MRAIVATATLIGILVLPAVARAEDPRPPPEFQRFTWTGAVTSVSCDGSINWLVDHVYSNGESPNDQFHREGIGASVAADDLRLFNAIGVRQAFYLPADAGTVCQLIAQPAAFSEDWATWLIPAEVDHLNGLNDVQQRVQGAISWANAQPGFVAQLFDVRRAGRPVFLFERDVDEYRSELAQRIPADIEFDVQKVDAAQLDRAARNVENDVQVLRAKGIDVATVEVVKGQNEVAVGVSAGSAESLTYLESHYPYVRAHAIPHATNGNLRPGTFYLRNLSCDPITGLKVADRYLVTIEYSNPLAVASEQKPVSDVAAWQLRNGGATLVFARGKPLADGRYAGARSLAAALAVASSGLPTTDTRPPERDATAPAPNYLPIGVGAVVGLLFLLKPRLLRRD
jgi:hypothetical protein